MGGPSQHASVWVCGLLTSWLQTWDLPGEKALGTPVPPPAWPCPMPSPERTDLALQSTHRAALGEVVRSAAQEVRPAPLPLHDGTGATSSLAEGAAGQLYPVVLALGHVHGTQQGLDHCPAARGIPEACRVATVGAHYRADPSSL